VNGSIDCSVQTLFTQFSFLSELEYHSSHKCLRDAHNSEAIACFHRHLLLQVRESTCHITDVERGLQIFPVTKHYCIQRFAIAVD